MGVRKVDYGENHLIDLTNDTVAPSVLVEGYTAHDADGEPITGRAILTGGGEDVQWGICETAGNQPAKVVELVDADSAWRLKVGMVIGVKYSNTNSINPSSPKDFTLNVQNSGPIPIYIGDNTIKFITDKGFCQTSDFHKYFGYKDAYIYYAYDGYYWVWCGWSVDENIYYRDMNQNMADAGTDTTMRVISAQILHQKIIKTPAHLIRIDPEEIPTENGAIWITTK